MRLVPNPYRWHEISLELFYGRQPLVDEMLDGFRKGYSYAVVGGRRMGKKTEKAKKLENEMDNFDSQIEQFARLVNEAYGHASGRTHVGATYEQAWRCLKQLDSILAQLLG